MLFRSYGRIVNITSPCSHFGFAGQANYAASKAGQIGLTRSLSKEVAKRKITVNCISPGFIDTAMTAKLTDDQKSKITERIPMGRMGTGKTTALKWDFLITATSPVIPASERPIFIFIDGQSNFTRFPKIENLNDEAREFCNEHGITDPNHEVLTFSNDLNRGDTTMGLEQLPVDSWIYLLAEAAANTEGTLIQEMNMARETLLRQQMDVNMENIRREVENRVNGNPQINFNIRNAIARVMHSPETNLFDQANKRLLTAELLFQQGHSFTLDVSSLNFNDRRAVVAYVAELLHHHKFVNGRHHQIGRAHV